MLVRSTARPLPILFLLLAMLAVVLAQPARALDLAKAELDGAILAAALEMGKDGDWQSAETMVRDADPLVRDVVLWRKLRAGKGSVGEYAEYISRRPGWPGSSVLERVVIGGGSASDGSLSGHARDSWRAMRRAMKKRKYEDAESILIEISASAADLQAPSRWAKDRLSLARRAAREGRWENAYRLASQHHLSPVSGYDYSDSEWVAGWVALRKLKDPLRAVSHFLDFRRSVRTPISLGRGGYWLGRAYEAAGNVTEAQRWYLDASKHQTSFYGQLAAARLGVTGDRRLAQSGLPDWEKHPMMRTEEVRLGAVLHYAGEADLAMATFSKLGETMAPGALAALTQLVIEIGQPHYAIRIAKKAARRGVVIYPAYYPLHDIARYTTKVEPAFALSIARQETELNPRAISRAGARGLMQLMPRTAQKVAGWIGEEYSRDRLIDDWQYNVRLGETYLARRTDQFDGSYVMAAAAYNAGAGRVDQWIAAYGDPRLGEIDMIDWMEQIPFNETRNYVQRVMEGLYVYRARLSGSAGPMTISRDLARGVL